MPQTVKAIRVAAYGGPEAMQLDELTIGEPGPGEARLLAYYANSIVHLLEPAAG